MKCPHCKNKMKNKSYLLWDLSNCQSVTGKDSVRWINKYKCKKCGTKIIDGEIKKSKIMGETDES